MQSKTIVFTEMCILILVSVNDIFLIFHSENKHITLILQHVLQLPHFSLHTHTHTQSQHLP